MGADAEFRQGSYMNDLQKVVADAKDKFDQLEGNLVQLYGEANKKFTEIEDMINKNLGRSDKDKKSGFFARQDDGPRQVHRRCGELAEMET